MPVRGSSSKPPSALPPRAKERFAEEESTARPGPDARERAEHTSRRVDNDLALQSTPSRARVSRGGNGGDLDFGGRDLSSSYTRASDDMSVTALGGFATTGAWARVSRTEGDKSVRAGGTLSSGWISGNAGVSWATLDGGAALVSGGAAWYPGGGGLDLSITRTAADGDTLKLGARGLFDVDRAVRDLGPATDGSGRRRIELRRSLGSSGTLSPGAAAGLLGIGVQLGAGHKRGVVYRTTVSEEDVRALVLEKKGVVGWLRNKTRAAGVAEDPIRVPDVRAPESLALGDELVTTVSGRFKAGLFIGGLPLRLGAQGVLQGDFQLGVRRLDEHRLEVVVTPTRVSGVQGRVGAPWLVEGDLGKAECAALTQGFVFDLREPEAKRAYDAVFDGELPGGLPNQVKGRRREAGELARALEQEALPAGVQRSYVDQVEVARSHKGVSTSFGIWFKGGRQTGLGVERARVEETRLRLDARGTVTTDTRGVELRRQLLLSGEEGRGVYASLARRTAFDDEGTPTRHFDGLTLNLELSDSRLLGRELDDEMIAALNESFGLSLPQMGRDGRKKSRAITVSRVLSAKDLEQLARHTDGPLASLARSLEGRSSLEQAGAVQEYVARGGLEAMGAIVRALGVPVVIDTVSSAYADPLAEARELSLRYPEPVSVDDDNRALAKRFTAGTDALKDTTLGLEDLEHDPLLDEDARASLRQSLLGAKAQVEEVLSVSHLTKDERSTLVAQLERGWTTSAERRVIDALTPQGRRKGPRMCKSADDRG